MKKIFLLTLSLSSIFFLTSCKKEQADDDTTITKSSSIKNTPACAYFNSEQTPKGWAQFIYFFDLSSGETKNKKYFKMQLKYVGVKDSFEMVTAPRTIDSLCKGFPADVKESVGYGWVHQWTNSQYRLLQDYTYNQYYKDTIVRNPQSNIYFLHQFYQSGALAGKWPQSNLDYVNEPLGNGQVKRHFRTIFWFKEGLCFDAHDMETFAQMKPISSYTNGAAGYDWTNVSSAVQIAGNSAGFQNIYFFDFKNWRFFKWKFYLNAVGTAPAQQAVVYEGYQSLDEFIKWPADWGKK